MSISAADENYLRSCMLIDIGRRAVQIHFDKEFHPKSLNKEIEDGQKKLNPLNKSSVITDIQWKILNDYKYNTLNSSDFDISLMICLLKHLAKAEISDILPHSEQTKPTDNIARIKFHRNAIVHTNRQCFSDKNFLVTNNAVCKAIRSFSEELYEECVRLDNTYLNLLNKDIILSINRAFKDMSDCKQKFKKLKKQLKQLKKRKSNPIPPKIRVEIAKQLKKWREDDNHFVRTKGSEAVFEAITKRQCVAVTGSFGVGKTAVLHNVGLQMGFEGFIVVPISYPWEIEKYNQSVKKNLFVVDNFCGDTVLDEEKFEAWKNCNVAFGERCKLLVSCKLHVYKALQHEKMNNIAFHECNLLSKDMCLLLNERQSIAEEYDIKISEIIDCIECYNCFPLLCKSFQNEDTIDAKAFFNNPFKVFEEQFKMLDSGQVCALLTLLMFYDDVPEVMITGDIQPAVKDVIEKTSNICNLNAQNSCLTIHKELENFIDTYVVKTGGVYHALNESIFNLLLSYFGQLMTEPLIMYSCTSFVKERFQLSDPSTNKEDYQLVVYVDSKQSQNTLTSHVLWDKIGLNAVILCSVEYRNLYIDRMFTDWLKGYVTDVFQNPNRYHFLFFKNVNSRNDLGTLMEKTDIFDGSTPMIVHCGDIYYVNSPSTNCYDAFLLWLISNGCPVNKANNKGETAIFRAARSGNFHMIQILVDHKADSNICEIDNGHSPLYVACLKGYKGIAKLLLQSGANCNIISKEGNTPLHAACCNGHTSIVTELLTRDANLSKKNNNGETPLDLARLNGHRHTLQTIIDNPKQIELN